MAFEKKTAVSFFTQKNKDKKKKKGIVGKKNIPIPKVETLVKKVGSTEEPKPISQVPEAQPKSKQKESSAAFQSKNISKVQTRPATPQEVKQFQQEILKKGTKQTEEFDPESGLTKKTAEVSDFAVRRAGLVGGLGGSLLVEAESKSQPASSPDIQTVDINKVKTPQGAISEFKPLDFGSKVTAKIETAFVSTLTRGRFKLGEELKLQFQESSKQRGSIGQKIRLEGRKQAEEGLAFTIPSLFKVSPKISDGRIDSINSKDQDKPAKQTPSSIGIQTISKKDVVLNKFLGVGKVLGGGIAIAGGAVLEEFGEKPVRTGAVLLGTGVAFRVAPKLATTGFGLAAGREVIKQPTIIEKVISGTTQAVSFGVFLGAGKAIQGAKRLNKVLNVKAEQIQTNIDIKLEGGKLVTRDFFKRADIGTAEVTGEALISARGTVKELGTPFGRLKTVEFIPKTVPVKVKFDPRKPPIPEDFLFRGRLKETTEIRPLASPKPGVSKPRVISEVEREIGGFGFPKDIEIASTPLRSIRTDPGIPSPFVFGKTTKVVFQFTPTKLSRSRSIVPRADFGARPGKKPKLKSTQIGLKPGILEESAPTVFAEVGGKQFVTTTKGFQRFPSDIKVTEGQGSIVRFFERKPKRKVIDLTKFPTSELAQVPIFAKKVKLTPSKPKKKGTIEIFKIIEKPVGTTVLQQLQQVAVLEEPKFGQQQKQKLKTKKKTKQQQVSINKILGTKQTAKTKFKTKQGVFTGLTPKQKVTQALSSAKFSVIPAQISGTKLDVGQAVTQSPKIAQVISQVPDQETRVDQRLKITAKLQQDLSFKSSQSSKLAFDLFTPPTPKKRIKKGRRPRSFGLDFDFPRDIARRGKRKKFAGRQFEFTPSLVALEGKVFGKRKKLEKEIFTGLDVRPIPL